MTHDHDHDHPHDHTHHHTHSHDQGRADGMSLEQKLEKLVTHWIDHNDSHKQTFFTWAERAEDEGLTGAADKIKKAGELSEQVTSLLKDALKSLEK